MLNEFEKLVLGLYDQKEVEISNFLQAYNLKKIKNGKNKNKISFSFRTMLITEQIKNRASREYVDNLLIQNNERELDPHNIFEAVAYYVLEHNEEATNANKWGSDQFERFLIIGNEILEENIIEPKTENENITIMHLLKDVFTSEGNINLKTNWKNTATEFIKAEVENNQNGSEDDDICSFRKFYGIISPRLEESHYRGLYYFRKYLAILLLNQCRLFSEAYDQLVPLHMEGENIRTAKQIVQRFFGYAFFEKIDTITYQDKLDFPDFVKPMLNSLFVGKKPIEPYWNGIQPRFNYLSNFKNRKEYDIHDFLSVPLVLTRINKRIFNEKTTSENNPVKDVLLKKKGLSRQRLLWLLLYAKAFLTEEALTNISYKFDIQFDPLDFVLNKRRINEILKKSGFEELGDETDIYNILSDYPIDDYKSQIRFFWVLEDFKQNKKQFSIKDVSLNSISEIIELVRS